MVRLLFHLVPTLVAVGALFALNSAPAVAQRPAGTLLTLSAGVAAGELRGYEGGGVVLALRLQRFLAGFVLVEPGVTVFKHTDSGADAVDLFPELGLQVEAPFRYVRPYIGAGLGYTVRTETTDNYTPHVLIGVRFQPAERCGLRAEARLRSPSFFSGGGRYLGELTGGLSCRIG